MNMTKLLIVGMILLLVGCSNINIAPPRDGIQDFNYVLDITVLNGVNATTNISGATGDNFTLDIS